MNRFFLFLLTISSLLASACSDEWKREQNIKRRTRDWPGGYTQRGANTFGCTVNGKRWWANYRTDNGFSNLAFKNPHIQYGGRGADFGVTAQYFSLPGLETSTFQMGFFLSPVDTGVFDFINSSAAFYYHSHAARKQGLPDSCNDFELQREPQRGYENVSGRGALHIRYLNDSLGIAAGTFWADLWRPGCPDTVRIRDGFFDVKI